MQSTYTRVLLCWHVLSGDTSVAKGSQWHVQVLRVLIPLYAKFLPQGPFWQRLTATMMLGGATYTILLALKIFVGLGLQMHAAWYLRRCKYKEGHPHAD